MQKDNSYDNTFREDDSFFDILDWVLKIFKYWYLFVFSLIIAWGLAYLENKTWKPMYKTSARIILGENSLGISSSEYNFMQGFGGSSNYGYRNLNNQLLLFSSRDIISRTISHLDFTVDYYTKGRFKTNYLYKKSPIEITNYTVSESGYGPEFVLTPIDHRSFQIKIENSGNKNDFSVKGEYGYPLKTPYFNIIVRQLRPLDNNIYFRFRSPVDLENDFYYRLSLNFVKERSTVLEVSLTGENIERDEDFINELCLQYQAFSLERKNDAAIKTITFIEEQLAVLSDSLMNTEEKMREFRSKSGIIDLSAYAGQLITKSSSIESAFTSLKLKNDYLDYLTKYLDSNVRVNNIVTPVGLGIDDPILINLVDEMMKMNDKISQIGERNPYYQIYTDQLTELKTRIYEALKNMKVTLDIERQDLVERQQNLSSGIVSLTDKERTMQNIQRRYKINESYYNFLLQKRADAQIQKASNSADNIILDRARLDTIVNSGVKNKVYSSYFLIGLIIPLIFIVLKTLLDNTIKTKKDIEKITPFPVIGNLIRTSFKEDLPVLHRPKSLFTEKFREIRTRVEFMAQKTKGISLMITSTEPGDGKTFLSANLAAVYGFSSGKTLLIDMDYRRPSICRLLGIQASKGVSNYLIGQASLDEIFVKNSAFNFDILPAGTIPPNPGELIKMEKMKQMVEQLKSEYDYIIIDTSPIGLVSDSYTIAGMVDLMLYVVRYNKTSKKFFKNIISQLRQDGLKHINIVLNDIDKSSNGYGYGGNSRYYGLKRKNSYYMDRAGYYAEEYFDKDHKLKDS